MGGDFLQDTLKLDCSDYHRKIFENDLITRIQLPNTQHMLSAVIWISLEYTHPVSVDFFCSASLVVCTLAVQGYLLF